MTAIQSNHKCLSPSEKGRKGGLKGGYIGGKLMYWLDLGIHGATAEQRKEYSRIGLEAKGITPWVPAESTDTYYKFSEEGYLLRAVQSNIFRYTEGPHKGQPNLEEIANELNRIYHEGMFVRDRIAVTNKLKKIRMKKAKEI
jgi:hypothetical protein